MFKNWKIVVASLLFIPLLFSGIFIQKSEKSVDLHRNLHKNTPQTTEFITYWKEDFRKDENGEIISICDITLASYNEMYDKYVLLDDESRTEVNATPDYEEGYTIKDSIKVLVDRFTDTSKEENKKPTLSNSSTIIIIVVVAVFGMTVISIFFALKNGKIIK